MVTAGTLLAVSRMRTGRLVVVSIAAALAVVAVCLVPDGPRLVALGDIGAHVAYTRAHPTVTACLLLVAAVSGGAVTRATAYVLAVYATSGPVGDLRELWMPSQHPTDADLAAGLTSIPVDAWRGGWTFVAALVVARPLVALARSADGWVLRPIRARGGGVTG